MALRLIALLLLLLVCLELATAGRRFGRPGQWKKGKKYGGTWKGGVRHGQKKGGKPRFPMTSGKLERPYKRSRLMGSNGWESRLKLHFGCDRLTMIMSSVNESLHHRRQKLHRMFSGLLNHAQSHRGSSHSRRRSMKKALRYELDKLVEHQCQNTIRMVNMLQECNASRLVSFEAMWRHQYRCVHAKLRRIARRKGKKANVPDMCVRASAKPARYHKHQFPQHVHHVCQRLELLKCIVTHHNMTLPTVSGISLEKHPSDSFLSKSESFSHSSSSSDDDDDHHGKKRDRHGKWHKRGKLLFGIGALLLLLLSAVLLACFLRYRKKLQSRNKQIEKLETVAKENEKWTTPPDSTVAWLQAKGWHNPVYYALEEQAMKTPKVAL